jgi:hypothetical protein
MEPSYFRARETGGKMGDPGFEPGTSSLSEEAAPKGLSPCKTRYSFRNRVRRGTTSPH